MSPVSSPVSAQVLDAAIAWQLSLDSGRPVEREEFAKWHCPRRACSRLAPIGHARSALQRCQRPGPHGPAAIARRHSASGAQARQRLASVVAVIGLALFAGDRYLPIDYWLADQRTATGEQRTIRLADGTLINLNTHSAVDVRFDEKQRLVILQEGEILVETGHGDARPFIVETREGSMRALGTRFLVKREKKARA
jgi:transmembrane sensor